MEKKVYEFISKKTKDPIVEWKTCKISGKEFAIFQSDLDFYKKISPKFGDKIYEIPSPTLCPEERQRRRLAWRNEGKLYRRTCDATGKSMISTYSPDKEFKVYDQKIWRSDQWDPLEYGQDMDFSKPFFEQFRKLMNEVPRANLVNTNSENSEYTNYTANNKNCYLIFSNSYGNNENCFYGTGLYKSYNCADVIHIKDCAQCYDITDCVECTNIRYSSNCQNCSNGRFLDDCQNCNDCIGCVGLRGASYCIFNKQYSKEEYKQYEKKNQLHNWSGIQNCKKEYIEFRKTIPYKASEIEMSENCTGNYINASENCQICFDTSNTEDCKYLQYSVGQDKDVYDSSYLVDSSLCYENLSLVHGYHNLFCNIVRWEAGDLIYCDNCFNSKNCFGCIGLRNKEYCIFNKQYSKAEYEDLVAKIIKHMTKTKERGEFFPIEISPFAYNETIAQEFFPLTMRKSLEMGYQRLDKEYNTDIPQGMSTIKSEDLPDDIVEITDDILNKIIICSKSGKPFRIVKLELELYRKLGLPLPRFHPDVRHLERLHHRAGRELYLRNCDKTGNEIVSIYPQDVAFKVFSIEAYNKEIYG